MQDKMKSFLNHIHIDNIDDFDLDFDMVGRNRFNYQQIDMIITKDTPWDYDLLREFMDGLNSIDYPYTMQFSYRIRPKSEDAISLFENWYRYNYRSESDIQLSPVDNDTILIEYLDESFKERNQSIVKEFKSFLEFISYNFIEITEEVKPVVVEEEVDERSKKKLAKIATKLAQKEIVENSDEPDILDRNDVQNVNIEDEHRQNIQEVEDALLKQMSSEGFLGNGI